MAIKVYALGSCRLRAPLLHLHRAGLIAFTNAQSSWYAHNSAEILQRIAMTDGDLVVPDRFFQLILNRDSCATPWAEGACPIAPDSVGVFEISTRMQHLLGPYVLHSTCVAKQAVPHAQSHVMTQQTLADHVAALGARFARLILVGNIEYDPGLCRMNKGRVALNQMLRDMASGQPSWRYINPLDYVDRADPDRDLADHNHFRPAFERRMADHYLTTLETLPPAPFGPPAGQVGAHPFSFAQRH